jgi:hypothetical protein
MAVAKFFICCLPQAMLGWAKTSRPPRQLMLHLVPRRATAANMNKA